ncbi:MAG: hypothetical protein AAF367_15630 [Pseudomonadota bacterium]
MNAVVIDPKSVVLFAGATVLIALLLGIVRARKRRREPAYRWLVMGNVTLLLAVIARFSRPVIGFEFGALLSLLVPILASVAPFSRC